MEAPFTQNATGFNYSNLKVKKNNFFEYPIAIKGFELFASSSFGQKYILDRAKKGFVYEFEYLKFKPIVAEYDGIIFKKGVDVTIQIGDLQSDTAEGETYHETKDRRLKITVSISFSTAREWSTPGRLLRQTNHWSHELLYHGDTVEKLFFKAPNDVKSINAKMPFYTKDDYWHLLNWNDTAHGKFGFAILNHAKRIIWSKTAYGIFFLDDNIKYNENFYFQLETELSKKPTDKELLEDLFYGLPNDKYRINRIKIKRK